jgi:ABC-type multidrug transport system fused ATPase/permease subunit
MTVTESEQESPDPGRPSPPTARLDVPAEHEAWRGVATEDDDAVDREVGLRLAARSRVLLGSLLRPHRRAVGLSLLLVVVQNAAQLAGPLLIALAIDRGVPGVLAGDPGPLAVGVVGYLVCGLVMAGAQATFTLVAGRVGQNVLLDLRERVFRHSQQLSISFHERYTSGRVIARLTSDLDSIDDMLSNGLDGLLTALLSVVSIAVVLLVLDWPLALVVLGGFVPLLVVTRWFRSRSRTQYRITRTVVARTIVHFVETMNGVRAVQGFRRQPRNDEIMAGLSGDFARANTSALRLIARYTATVRLVGNLTLAIVLGVGAWRVSNGSLALGVVAAFVLYLRQFYGPLDELAMFLNSYQSAAAALEKISGMLEEPLLVADPADPAALPEPGDDGGRGDVRLADVSFAYSSAPDHQVLAPMSLHVPAGQTVALVGTTGAGKSTLAKLIARFYDPTAGTVRLDGVDLRDLTDADLRAAVAMVTQESFLFSGSVADNIVLGRPSASRDEVTAAARAVGADAFIQELPEGYDTDVRKRGGRLSAGQRQLVSFARAFLADPALLVLDEATSALDIPSERAVQRAMRTVLADRTALIIAHRLSTVLIADRVLVMAHGRVVEDGAPPTLIAAGGPFAALHQAWLTSTHH